MTPDQFCYWLQGLLELQPDLKTLNEAQVKTIREHMGYVFAKGHLPPAPRPLDGVLRDLAQRPPLAFQPREYRADDFPSLRDGQTLVVC
ncbi:MAG: hypothetical protein ACREVL_16540 [Solimonas sp.]